MDVLSEVLKVVKLQGALFYNAEFSSPWMSSSRLARFFSTGTEHVIVYHLLTEGRASVRLKDGDRVPLQAGDIVMIPHGDPHIVENDPALARFCQKPTERQPVRWHRTLLFNLGRAIGAPGPLVVGALVSIFLSGRCLLCLRQRFLSRSLQPCS